MSVEPTPHSAALLQYVADHTRPEDPFLTGLREAARAEGLPAISIGPAQASFLQVLLAAARVRDVVEVGTLGGYSAISLARALAPGGKVRTIEVSAKHAAFARAWAARSDVADRVEVLLGPGAEVLATLPGRSADAVFLDADKEGYLGYLEHARRLLRPGGLLLVDNAFAFGCLLDPDEDDASVLAIRRFNDALAAAPDFHGVIVPLGDGLWVATYRPAGAGA